MKKWSTVLVVAALAAMLAFPAAAQAAGGMKGSCSLAFTEQFGSGFTLTPSSGPQSLVGTSPAICTGTINGHEITGPGTIRNDGAYHNSTCLLDNASGRTWFTFPTEGGPVALEGTFSVARVGFVLLVEAELAGSRGTGFALVVPTKGECLLNPITEALVLMWLTF